jgi:thiamine-monophosphate kinase
LVGGDDYQLCFTIPAPKQAELITIGKKLQVSLTEIGLVTESQQLELRHNPLENKTSLNGFEHFHKNNC